MVKNFLFPLALNEDNNFKLRTIDIVRVRHTAGLRVSDNLSSMSQRPDRKTKNAKKEAMEELRAARERGGLSALEDFQVGA